MRDRRFVAKHRGGPLEEEQHRLLMAWALACATRVLPLLEGDIDPRLRDALRVGAAWEAGEASVGAAQKAAVLAHAAARDAASPVAVAVARAVGHAVATAHMADHAIGSAMYARKALRLLGRPVEPERAWQNASLPDAVRALVLTSSKHAMEIG